jgi:hypothetical protein
MLAKGAYFEVQAQCHDVCCEHDPGTWRKSQILPREIQTPADAKKFLETYSGQYFKSKPYRLVLRNPDVIQVIAMAK